MIGMNIKRKMKILLIFFLPLLLSMSEDVPSEQKFVLTYFSRYRNMVEKIYNHYSFDHNRNVWGLYQNSIRNDMEFLIHSFEDPYLFRKRYQWISDFSVELLGVLQQYNCNLYPFFYTQIEEISSYMSPDGFVTVDVFLTSKHLCYGSFLSFNEENEGSFLTEPEELNQLYLHCFDSFKKNFESGNIEEGDFLEAYRQFSKLDLDDIYFKGAVLIAETRELHTFTLKSKNHSWTIIDMKRNLWAIL